MAKINSGIFVTGTDTGVGKTVVSASLMHALRGREQIRYWKPIQTGIEEDNDTEIVKKLADCSKEEVNERGFRLERPLSPHLSAKLANIEITIEKIIDFAEEKTEKGFWVIEGAGGVLVPLNKKVMMLDLMLAFNLPVLVVSRSGLGTINHTLLTLQILRSSGLEVLGVIMNGDPNAENRKAVEYYGKISVLAEMPKFEKLDCEGLKSWSLKKFQLGNKKRNFICDPDSIPSYGNSKEKGN